jgi:hypothetical protein
VTARVLRVVPDGLESRPEEPDLTEEEQAVHRVRCYVAAAIACGASEVEVMDAAREGIRLGRAMTRG